MLHNKQFVHSEITRLLRSARPAEGTQRLPQITIRGDHNLIHLGSSGGLKLKTVAAESAQRPPRSVQWPQQILDAIRVKAADKRYSPNDLCEVAGRALGRVVLTLEKLSARDLARVYERLCANERKD
jgi:hypothetical protein